MNYRKLHVNLNLFRNQYEAVCPKCKETVFSITDELVRSSGMPVPTYFGHSCD